MPHQCLTCGETFADGSDDLLKGCPSCDGTRFFFTEEPLDEDERQELADQTGQSAQQMLEEILEDSEKPDLDEDIFSREAWEDWIRSKVSADANASPEDGDVDASAIQDLVSDDEEVSFEPLSREEEKEQLRSSESVQVSLEDVQETDAPELDAGRGEDSTSQDAPVPANGSETAFTEPGDAETARQPSTLNIRNPGEYEIDVERLMDDSPVIVERDGSYVIHLPSVFGKKKDR